MFSNLNVGKYIGFPPTRYLHKKPRYNPPDVDRSLHRKRKKTLTKTLPQNPNLLSKPPTYPTMVDEQKKLPWVELKYTRDHPHLYPNAIKATSPDIKGGSLVNVYIPNSNFLFGIGLFNPIAKVPLRIVQHGVHPFTETDFFQILDAAVNLRHVQLRLHETSNTYRVINSDGDGLTGLVVDRFADVLSVSVHSLGVWQRLPVWLPYLHERLGTRRVVLNIEPEIAKVEGIDVSDLTFDDVNSVCVNENGVKYEVNFDKGHKTGFFCDQRENRLLISQLTQGRRVLDLCCYTGGFSLSSLVKGGALNATGVEVDPFVIDQARSNAKLNHKEFQLIKEDVFSFARGMIQQCKTWDVVVLDPPKFILSRFDGGYGYRKYADLNEMVIKLVEVGGILVTCSCSGLISEEEFEKVVMTAGRKAGRRLQILCKSGAGKDHPVMSNCPESEYLKVLWLRVLK